MSFHLSSERDSIRLDGSTLICSAFNSDGQAIECSLDLNTCIGNNNGTFEWSGQNFADSAENLTFDFENDVPVLRAELRDVEGELHARDINLGERIGNENGCLVFN